ncbi:FAD-dependent oxidoreductase [Phenylobacterium sp.]|uniref:FAD-dependent oxidoreductase n=1 Tax=Phenylobacterium sp. TaxID=1871053 RepID=UPI0039835762
MRVGIVGAGMAGLACTGGLARQGHEVVLLDKGRGPGGRMSTRRMQTAPRRSSTRRSVSPPSTTTNLTSSLKGRSSWLTVPSGSHTQLGPKRRPSYRASRSEISYLEGWCRLGDSNT